MIKIKNLCINLNLKYWDENKLNGWAMFQKLPLGGFNWAEETCKFNESFIRSYNEVSDMGYFLEVNVKNPENLPNFHKDLPILSEKKED